MLCPRKSTYHLRLCWYVPTDSGSISFAAIEFPNGEEKNTDYWEKKPNITKADYFPMISSFYVLRVFSDSMYMLYYFSISAVCRPESIYYGVVNVHHKVGTVARPGFSCATSYLGREDGCLQLPLLKTKDITNRYESEKLHRKGLGSNIHSYQHISPIPNDKWWETIFNKLWGGK